MTAFRRLARFGPFGLALLVLLVSSGMALIHAAWNRSGEPRAVLELTERELHPVLSWTEEDTGLSLNLSWRALDARISPHDRSMIGSMYQIASTSPEWLMDPDRLGDLGFDVSVPLDAPGAALHYHRLLPRRVFVAYQMEGDSWDHYLASVRRTLEECPQREVPPESCPDETEIEERLQNVQRLDSRLFAIDAASDAATLLEKYADRPGTVVLPASVELIYQSGNPEEDEEPEIRGYLQAPEVSSLHAPLPMKGKLERWLKDPEPWEHERGPRFRARVAWGRFFEPWLLEVEHLPRERAEPNPQEAQP